MKSVKEVLQLGLEKYKNEPNSFMCCVLDDFSDAKIITKKESDRAQKRISKIIDNQYCLTIYLQLTNDEYDSLVKKDGWKSTEANRLRVTWWQNQIDKM